MPDLTTPEEILDFAIKTEQQVGLFYSDWAKKVKRPGTKLALEQYAKDQLARRDELLKVKKGEIQLPLLGRVQDLKIADHLVERGIDKDSHYRDVLVYAMKKEKAAFKLYYEMADETHDTEAIELLLALAQEKATRKLQLELEYDEEILKKTD
jgi:rubrerythrin